MNYLSRTKTLWKIYQSRVTKIHSRLPETRGQSELRSYYCSECKEIVWFFFPLFFLSQAVPASASVTLVQPKILKKGKGKEEIESRNWWFLSNDRQYWNDHIICSGLRQEGNNLQMVWFSLSFSKTKSKIITDVAYFMLIFKLHKCSSNALIISGRWCTNIR